VATLEDLDRIALALPESTREQGADGRVAYAVRGKGFCHHREPRPDAIDAITGERITDAFMFRVADLDEKDLLLADPRGVYFTTPHFTGYPAVLVRIPRLAELTVDELADVVEGAWLTRAPKRTAAAWLAGRADH
jgi:hypothetical protein